MRLFSLALVLCTALVQLAAQSLPGQIIRDPAHPQWFLRNGGDHVFICGPGDPEGFLFRGTRNADGTRTGDQMALIDKLIAQGGNSIYMQAVRSGGDGGPTENPFVDSDPAKGVDPTILDQWEEWFTRMDDHGILIYLFLYDDVSRPFGGGSEVPAGEEAFIQTLVDRFEHHRNLIWLVGEETNEAYSNTRVRNIATRIRHHDDYDHLIGHHHGKGPSQGTWIEGGALDHYSMQNNVSSAADVHADAIAAFANGVAAGSSGNGYQTIYSENTKRRGNNIGDTRNMIWEVAMGGLQVMRLGMDIAETPDEALNACRYLQQFFEQTDFYTMVNADALAYGDTTYVLADSGRSYIAYGLDAGGGLGLQDLPADSYDLDWT